MHQITTKMRGIQVDYGMKMKIILQIQNNMEIKLNLKILDKPYSVHNGYWYITS